MASENIFLNQRQNKKYIYILTYKSWNNLSAADSYNKIYYKTTFDQKVKTWDKNVDAHKGMMSSKNDDYRTNIWDISLLLNSL